MSIYAACSVCGKQATIAPYQQVYPSATSTVVIPGLLYSNMVDRPYCALHDPTGQSPMMDELERLRTALAASEAREGEIKRLRAENDAAMEIVKAVAFAPRGGTAYFSDVMLDIKYRGQARLILARRASSDEK